MICRTATNLIQLSGIEPRPVSITPPVTDTGLEKGQALLTRLPLILALLTFTSCAHTGMKTYESLMLPPAGQAPGDAPRVTATWLGTAGIYLEDGTTGILIDPFVTRSPLLKVFLGMDLKTEPGAVEAWIRDLALKNVQGVLVSHSHYDHSMDAPEFARQLNAPLFGSESTANIGRGAGLPEEQIRVVEPGRPVRMGDFEVTFLESRHGPALFGRIPYPGEVLEPLVPPASVGAYRLGETYSILIAHPCGRVLHHGSAGFKPGVLEKVQAEVVLLGIAGRQDTEEYLHQVVDAVGARRVIPIHFDNFFRPLSKPARPLYRVKLQEFFRTAGKHRPALNVEALPLCKPVSLFPTACGSPR